MGHLHSRGFLTIDVLQRVLSIENRLCSEQRKWNSKAQSFPTFLENQGKHSILDTQVLTTINGPYAHTVNNTVHTFF